MFHVGEDKCFQTWGVINPSHYEVWFELWDIHFLLVARSWKKSSPGAQSCSSPVSSRVECLPRLNYQYPYCADEAGGRYCSLNHKLHPWLFQSKLRLFAAMLSARLELYTSEVKSSLSRSLILNSLSSTICFHEWTSIFLISYDCGTMAYFSNISLKLAMA